EGDRRALRLDDRDGLLGLLDDRDLVVAQAQAGLVVGAAGLLVVVGLDALVQRHGAVADLDLQGQHLFAALLELRQDAFDLFLAQLAEQLFQLFLGVLQLFEGLVLLVAGALFVVLFQFLDGLLLVLDGLFDLLASRQGLLRRLRGLRGLRTATAAALAVAGLALAALTALAALAFAGLAFAAHAAALAFARLGVARAVA